MLKIGHSKFSEKHYKLDNEVKWAVTRLSPYFEFKDGELTETNIATLAIRVSRLLERWNSLLPTIEQIDTFENVKQGIDFCELLLDELEYKTEVSKLTKSGFCSQFNV